MTFGTMAMPLLRICLILAICTLTSRSTAAFRSTTNALQATAWRKEQQQRQLCSSLATTSSPSSDEDLPTNNDSPPRHQQQQPPQHPRAAVSIALRCCCGENPYYLLIRRGNEPNKGEWALPGGKLEWGESTLDGAKRELSEEVLFDCDTSEGEDDIFSQLAWCPEPFATADSITEGFHYLIAVCFAEWKGPPPPPQTNDIKKDDVTPLLVLQIPPSVTASDDAIDARWWSMDEIMELEEDAGLKGTKGFVQKMKRTEFLYQQGVLRAPS